jgi:acetyl-CoA acetyltransferase
MMRQVRIVGVGTTALGRLNRASDDLCREALRSALADARLTLQQLDGLVSVPSMAQPHFMQAHSLATTVGVFPQKKNFVVKTVDAGGAGPLTALTSAVAMIRSEWCETVAVVGGDAVLSLDHLEFLRRADNSVSGSDLPSPCIPHGYDRYAQWHMKQYGVTREQLAMVPVIESHLAVRHPAAICRAPITLDDVLRSRSIAPVTNLLECARRADGAACLLLASDKWYRRTLGANAKPRPECPVVEATGEASGRLYPPATLDEITEDLFSSATKAATVTYKSAQLGSGDIDWFSVYDCFPICLLRGLESVRLCRPGEGGAYIQEVYTRLLKTGKVDTKLFPVNTHGGLLAFGAPWEAPALFGVAEAVAQLTGKAGERQLSPRPKRALAYANGGIFSASSVAVLGDGEYGGEYRFVRSPGSAS